MSTVDVAIREACVADIPEIVELWRELVSFHEQWEPFFQVAPDGHLAYMRFLNEFISYSNLVALVADSKGKIVGFGTGRIQYAPPSLQAQEIGEIVDMAVSSAYRRCGVGEKLVAGMREWFQRRNITRLHVNVLMANPVSTAFWSKMGFASFMQKMAYNNSSS